MFDQGSKTRSPRPWGRMGSPGALAALLTVAGAALGQHTEAAKLTASDAAAGDNLGAAVAVSNGRVIAGARGDDTGRGAAYVFQDTGSGWAQAKLVATLPGGALDRAANDNFGIAVALSGDVAVVGSWQDNHAGISSGSAYVFRYDGSSWVSQAKLLASDRANTDRFGIGVAIDGNVIVIGADRNGPPGATDAGAAYVYRYNGASWTQEAKLTATDAENFDGFGERVAVSGDDIIVGARFDSDADLQTGAAYVFHYDGGAWSEQAKLTAADAALGDQFGNSVALSGHTALVGARLDSNIDFGDGSAYVFDRVGTTWSQSAKLAAADAQMDDNFGSSVAIHGDVALIGSFLDNAQSGSAYVFLRSGAAWSQNVRLMASDGDSFDQFGGAVAIDANHFAVVGSAGDDDGGSSAGAAYAFQIATGSVDSDGDGLTDTEEFTLGTDPNNPDTDNDGLTDGAEVALAAGGPCPNPLTTDSDDDGLNDGVEVSGGTAPCNDDSDGDGLSDGAEASYGTNPLVADTDGDGLSDGQEVLLAAGGGCPSPTDADSDDDGLLDGAEVSAGTSPCGADTDGDGLSDGQEGGFGTNPLDPDTDADGLFDGVEVNIAMGGGCPSPLNPDSDGDSLSDGEEVLGLGTSPCSIDSDGDGIDDAVDPLPAQPGVTGDFLADWTRDVADTIRGFPASSFAGQNQVLRLARRVTLAALVDSAAFLVDVGAYNAARAILTVATRHVDGQSAPPDWVVNTADRLAVQGELNVIQTLLDLLQF